MNGWPAYEEARIVHGCHAVSLRPTLRVASQLEAALGLEHLFRDLQAFRLSTVLDVVLIAAVDPAAGKALCEALADRPLATIRETLLEAVSATANGFTPRSSRKASARPTPGEPRPWSEAYAILWRAASSVLNWTPDAIWQATPTEILAALEATDPDTLDSADTPAQQPAPETFDREAFAAFKSRIAQQEVTRRV